MTKTQSKINEALAKIDEGLEQINTNEEWLHFLAFQSMFYNYSFGNTMLIYLQNPNASYVKGFKAWNSLGRYVKKGEKGIAILAPCFKKVPKNNDTSNDDANTSNNDGNASSDEKVKVIGGFRISYVYDIQSTDGDDEMLPTLVKGLSGTSDEIESLFTLLRGEVENTYKVKDTIGTSEKGSYNLATHEISIRSDLDCFQRFKTLIHEYAHALNFESHPWEEEDKRNQRELIAEGSSFVVCHALGLDTKDYSFPYLKTWLQEKDELKELTSTIQKISSKILSLLIVEEVAPSYV